MCWQLSFQVQRLPWQDLRTDPSQQGPVTPPKEMRAIQHLEQTGSLSKLRLSSGTSY